MASNPPDVTGRPARQAPGWRLSFLIGLPVLAAAGIALLLWINPQDGGDLIPCLFYQYTGLYCVGCGTTRALGALLRGRFLDALSFNMFMIFWLPWPIYAAVREWLRLLLGRQLLPALPERRPWLIALAVSAVAFMILRNLPVWPLSWLAP